MTSVTDVVMTGVGIVSPMGATAAETAGAWASGACAPRRRVSDLDGTSLAGIEAGASPEFDAAQRLGGRRMLKYMSDATVLGCVAAREAFLQSAAGTRFAPERIGLYAGTGLASASVRDVIPMLQASLDDEGRFSCRLLGEKGLAVTNPLLSFKILANMPPCMVSIQEKIKGPSLIFTPWGGQTAAAIQEAYDAVATGDVDCALAGAADDPSSPATLVHLVKSGHLGDGEFASPAAAYLVLERAQTAQRDGRTVLAHLDRVDVVQSDGAPHDPLSERMGRTYAAAPALLLALSASHAVDDPVRLRAVDGIAFAAGVRRPA